MLCCLHTFAEREFLLAAYCLHSVGMDMATPAWLVRVLHLDRSGHGLDNEVTQESSLCSTGTQDLPLLKAGR